MKINVEKIKMFQAGGYLTYRPLTSPPEQLAPQEQPTMAEQKASAKAAAIDDKALDKLLGNGLTNDVMQFSDEITAAQTRYDSLTDSEKEGPEGRHMRSILKGNLGQLNALLRSKQTFERAVSKATANGAMEEFAVTPQGFVVKKSDGTLGQVSFAQFTKDKTSGDLAYKPLTNAELASEREFNKSLVGNTKVFSILDYGKGIEEVQKEVLGIATGLGKSSSANATGAYDDGTVEAMREARLQAGQGVFKVKESVSSSSNSAQIQRAKEVMWATLSDNSKNVLRARAAWMEKDPARVEQRAALLAMDLLDPKLDTSKSVSTDMAYTKGAKGSGIGGSGGPVENMGARESAVNGKTQQEHLSLLSDYGVNINSRMNVLPYEDITRKDKDGVVRPTTINGSDLAKYGFVNKATTLNGDKVDPNQTMFTGDAYYTRLPVKKLANGSLMLDEEGAKKIAEAERQIAALPETQRTTQMKESIRQKVGATGVQIQEVMLAEAASYDNKYTLLGLRGARDKKYYKDADDSITKLLGEVVDPEEKGARNWLDYKAYQHMIIIPSKGEAAARFADSNQFVVPRDGVNLANPLRPVLTSERSYGGRSTQPSPSIFSQDALNN